MESFETQRLIIRELQEEDAKRFGEYRDKKEVAYYQSWWRYSYNKAVKRIEYCIKHPFDGKMGNYQLGVVLKDNNYFIGDYFLEVNEPNVVTIGYTFDSDFWHHGYAMESLKAVLALLKNEYGFKRVLAYVYDDNEPSIRLLKKIGFIEFEKSFIMGDVAYRLDL